MKFQTPQTLEKIAAILILISALINFSCNFLLIPKYGLIGCAISTTLSIIFYNMCNETVPDF